MVGLTAAFALADGTCLAVVAAVAAGAEVATPTPSRVPAMATDAPAAASFGTVSFGRLRILMP
jgi:hypothetical protein